MLAGSIESSYWVTWASTEQGVIVLAGSVGSSYWVTWAEGLPIG